jgi:hypothetical protein
MMRILSTTLLLALASPVLNAGSFAVNPVRLTLDPGARPVAAMTVRNDSDVAAVVQADAIRRVECRWCGWVCATAAHWSIPNAASGCT